MYKKHHENIHRHIMSKFYSLSNASCQLNIIYLIVLQIYIFRHHDKCLPILRVRRKDQIIWHTRSAIYYGNCSWFFLISTILNFGCFFFIFLFIGSKYFNVYFSKYFALPFINTFLEKKVSVVSGKNIRMLHFLLNT